MNQPVEQTMTSVRMPPETFERAKKTAEQNGLTMSSFVRFAMIAMMDQMDKGEPQ